MLWYEIKERKFGYKEFLSRYHSYLFTDYDTLWIFILLTLGSVPPYVNKDHVTRKLSYNPDIMNSRDLLYTYIYIIIRGSDTELLDEDNPYAKLSDLVYNLPTSFPNTLLDAIKKIYSKYFDLRFDPDESFRDMEPDIETVNSFINQLFNEESFVYHGTDEQKTKLFLYTSKLIDCIKILRGEDAEGGESPTSQYVAVNGKRLIQYINPSQYHINEELYTLSDLIELYSESNDYDFKLYSVKELTKLFPNNQDEIQILIKPNREKELNIVIETFEDFDPMLFICPSMEKQDFIDLTKQSGIEAALSECVKRQKDYLEAIFPDRKVANETTLITCESIHWYPMSELIWITQDDIVYAFAREDLKDQTVNPYTRMPLQMKVDGNESISYYERWTRRIQRRIPT